MNRKVYVGQTCQTLRRRWQKHIRRAVVGGSQGDTHFCRAIRKYGADSFHLTELASGANRTGADVLETLWIKRLRANHRANGYNGSTGGEGAVPTPETRAKQSEAHRGKKLSAAHIAALTAARKKHPPASPETCAKISAAKKGKPNSPAHNEKVRQANLGKKMSAACRAKISAALTGKKKSPQHVAAVVAALAKKRKEQTV